MADSANAKSAESAATAADIGVLVVIAKLGDTANQDRIQAEQLADPRGRVRVGTVGVGEVLLGHDLLHRLALDQ